MCQDGGGGGECAWWEESILLRVVLILRFIPFIPPKWLKRGLNPATNCQYVTPCEWKPLRHLSWALILWTPQATARATRDRYGTRHERPLSNLTSCPSEPSRTTFELLQRGHSEKTLMPSSPWTAWKARYGLPSRDKSCATNTRAWNEFSVVSNRMEPHAYMISLSPTTTTFSFFPPCGIPSGLRLCKTMFLRWRNRSCYKSL